MIFIAPDDIFLWCLLSSASQQRGDPAAGARGNAASAVMRPAGCGDCSRPVVGWDGVLSAAGGGATPDGAVDAGPPRAKAATPRRRAIRRRRPEGSGASGERAGSLARPARTR